MVFLSLRLVHVPDRRRCASGAAQMRSDCRVFVLRAFMPCCECGRRMPAGRLCCRREGDDPEACQEWGVRQVRSTADAVFLERPPDARLPGSSAVKTKRPSVVLQHDGGPDHINPRGGCHGCSADCRVCTCNSSPLIQALLSGRFFTLIRMRQASLPGGSVFGTVIHAGKRIDDADVANPRRSRFALPARHAARESGRGVSE